MWGCGMSGKFEVLNLCDSAIDSLSLAYRMVAGMDVPYVADMLFDAISVVEQVVEDMVIKGGAYER